MNLWRDDIFSWLRDLNIWYWHIFWNLGYVIWFVLYIYLFIIVHFQGLDCDGFQPKTSPFSTCHLIWVNHEVLIQLSPPMSILFSYLNNVRQNSVIELCLENIFCFFLWFLEKRTSSFFTMVFLLFSIMHFFTFISPGISQFYSSPK